MTPDQNQHPIVRPDHRLPAPPKEHSSLKALRIAAWIVIPLIFALGFYLVLHHHEEEKKTATSSRRGAAGGTATVTPTTAKKESGIRKSQEGVIALNSVRLSHICMSCRDSTPPDGAPTEG